MARAGFGTAFVAADDPAVSTTAVVLDGCGTTLTIPGRGFLTGADFQREGPDLVLMGENGQTVLVTGYFANPHPPLLVSPDGAAITPDLAGKLAGPLAPGQIAQAGAAQTLVVVGTVSKASGTVEVMHPDGTRSTLKAGDTVYQGDVISTKDESSVALTFADSSTLSLGKSGRMVIDELVYDPNAQTGHSTLSVVKGAFSLVSGHIAKSAPDAATLKTPVMTIGIRGTSVAGMADGEGQANSIVLLQDPDGTVGQILVTNAGGSVVISQSNFLTFVGSYAQPPSAPVYVPAAQIYNTYGDVMGNQPGAPTPTTEQPQQAPDTNQSDPLGTSQQEGSAAPVQDDSPLSPPPPTPEDLADVVVPIVVPQITAQVTTSTPVPTPGPVTEATHDDTPQQPTQSTGGSTNQAPEISGDIVAVFVMDEGNPPSVSGTLDASDPESTSLTSTYTQASALGGIVTVTDDGYGTLTWTYVPPSGTIATGNDQDSFSITVTDADGVSTTQIIKLYANLSPNTNSPALSSTITSVTVPAVTWTSIFGDSAQGPSISAGDSDSTYILVKITLHPGGDDSGGEIRCGTGSQTITSDDTITFVTTAAQVADLLKTLQYKGSADENDTISVSISDDGETWTNLSSDVSVTVTAPASSNFIGTTSHDFTLDANWSSGRPGSTTAATIAGKTVVLSEYDHGNAASLAVTASAALSIVGDLNVDGLFRLDSTSILSVSGELQAGTIELRGTTTIDGGYLTGQEAIWLYGSTTVLSGGATFSGTTTHVESGGTLTISSQATADFRSLTNEGTIHLVDGGTAAISGSSHSFQNSSLIWGDGTIAIDPGSIFTNNGTLRPGGDNEIGHLTVDGSASLGDSSVIEIEFDGSSSHDLLTFDDLVSLNGSLSLDIDPASGSYGYEATPTAIITGVSSGSWFDDVTLVSTSNGNGVVGVWLDGSDILAKSAVFATGQTATYSGSAADETIFGAKNLNNSIDAGAGNDTVRGGNGNDTIVSGGGSDSIFGGDGNDAVVIQGTDYATLDGGAGTDTLKILADLSLDLDTLSATAQNFEKIDLSAAVVDLSLSWDDVVAFTGNGSTLIIDGGSDDAVNFGDGFGDWAQGTNVTIDNHSYQQYTNAAHNVTVYVANEVSNVTTVT